MREGRSAASTMGQINQAAKRLKPLGAAEAADLKDKAKERVMIKAKLTAITHSSSITKQFRHGLPFAAALALVAAASCTLKESDKCGCGGEDSGPTTTSKGGKPAATGGATVVEEGSGGTVVGSGGTTSAPTGGATVVAAAGSTAVATGGATVVATGGATVVAAAGSTAVGAGGTTVVATGGATGVAGATMSVTTITEAQACATATLPLGLSMYILQDATGSMTAQTCTGTTSSTCETLWSAVSSAISTFVTDADSKNISAGIGFYSVYGTTSDPCTVANYETAAVPVAQLSTNASLITSAIAAQSPNAGETPTPAALKGALTYARSVAAARGTTDRVILVLATDGGPNDCYTTNPVTDTSAAAAAGLTATPAIPTYVLGVFASSDPSLLDNLNAFAKAGGTGSAFVIDPSAGGGKSMRAMYANAMGAIRDANMQSCTIPLPAAPTAGQVADPMRAALTYKVGTTTSSIAWRERDVACDPVAGGYYYDNNAAPTTVSLCPATCQIVQNGTSATLGMRFGCKAGQSTGAGGAGNDPGRGPACLLSGQSCTTSASCCSLVCSAGVCAG